MISLPLNWVVASTFFDIASSWAHGQPGPPGANTGIIARVAAVKLSAALVDQAAQGLTLTSLASTECISALTLYDAGAEHGRGLGDPNEMCRIVGP